MTKTFGLALLFVSLLMLLLVAGCGDRPPMLTIKAGKQEVHVERGGYSWRFLAGHVIADSPGPSDMVKIDEDAAVLPPGTELKLSFGSNPKKMVLSQWEGRDEISQVELKSKTFKLPAEKGTYLYSIHAEWRKGNALYAFAVKVQ